MLLKSLLARLFSRTQSHVSVVPNSGGQQIQEQVYEKYPNLPDLVLKLLSPDCWVGRDTSDPELGSQSHSSTPQVQKVFPALEIIQKAGIPKSHRMTVRAMMWIHLGSAVWYIREKAAKAISCISCVSTCVDEMEKLLQPTWLSQNALHGRLLCVQKLMPMVTRITPGM